MSEKAKTYRAKIISNDTRELRDAIIGSEFYVIVVSDTRIIFYSPRYEASGFSDTIFDSVEEASKYATCLHPDDDMYTSYRHMISNRYFH